MENQNVNKYNNSLIYKIVCKDINIKNVYVGSTCNFKRRHNDHKNNTSNQNGKEYNRYLYQIVRANGGWDNWDMVLVEKCNVNDKLELHRIERNKMEELKADLNKCIPTRTQAEWNRENEEKMKHYYKNWGSTIVICECGCSISRACINRHIKRDIHINKMQEINNAKL